VSSIQEHFSTEAAGAPIEGGRFVEVAAISPLEIVPGLQFRPVPGEGTLVNFVHFAPHSEAPRHVHKEEQIVIVLDGEFDFELDGQVRTVRRGDVVVVPSWVPHGARTYDGECLEVDVFNPPRQTLLDYARSERERLAASDVILTPQATD
jgi:quercetin dioxygenase-like cupin family protein